MTLSVTKLPGGTMGIYANMQASDKPILLHRIILQWFDKSGKMFASNAFRPDQFIEENISILVASMPVTAGAASVQAVANYEVIDGVETSSKLTL